MHYFFRNMYSKQLLRLMQSLFLLCCLSAGEQSIMYCTILAEASSSCQLPSSAEFALANEVSVFSLQERPPHEAQLPTAAVARTAEASARFKLLLAHPRLQSRDTLIQLASGLSNTPYQLLSSFWLTTTRASCGQHSQQQQARW
jgi:hypothetical protein